MLRTEQRLLGVGLPGCLFGVLGLYGFRERDTGCRPKVVSFARATPHGPRRARALRRRYVHRSNHARGACGVTGRLTRNRTTERPALYYIVIGHRERPVAPRNRIADVQRSHGPTRHGCGFKVERPLRYYGFKGTFTTLAKKKGRVSRVCRLSRRARRSARGQKGERCACGPARRTARLRDTCTLYRNSAPHNVRT